MRPWCGLPIEERHLLNPCFCAVLLWTALRSNERAGTRKLSFAEYFIVLPLVLPLDSRTVLPRTVRTSLAVWTETNPRISQKVGLRSKALLGTTRRALAFGLLNGLLDLDGSSLRPRLGVEKQLLRFGRSIGGDASPALKASEFVGKWFPRNGNSATVLALLGVRP